MNRPINNQDQIATLLNPAVVAAALRDCIDWPDGLVPEDVAVERFWPARHGAFAFEWSFRLGDQGRRTIFGRTGQTDAPQNGDRCLRPVIIPDGLRGVRTHVTALDLLVHTPDCDPDLLQLAECLDPASMAPRLAAAGRDGGGANELTPAGLETALLAYRAGKRAVVSYRLAMPGGTPLAMIGKVHRSERGEPDVQRYARLNEQLAWSSNRRIRVPTVVGRLPDLHLTLYAVAPHGSGGESDDWSTADASRVVDALALLHRCRVGELPAFLPADELAIVRRWHGLLRLVDPLAWRTARHLVDRIEALAQRVEPTTNCTVHRDFYERQIILGRRTVTILDLDTLAEGDACVDLGNLLAHLRLRSLMRGVSETDIQAAGVFIMGRYESIMGPIDPVSFAFHCASSLFRIGSVHAARTRTRRYASALWDAAERILAGHTSPFVAASGPGDSPPGTTPVDADRARPAASLEKLA